MVLGLIAIGLAVAVPSLAYIRTEGRAAAAARFMASRFHALRWKSVAGRRGRGLLFERSGDGWVWWEAEDGNGNGLRTAEIRRGIDPVRSGPHRLEEVVERAELGFPPVSGVAEIPPRSGTIQDRDDPVQFGRTDLVSFSPSGSASSGTIYVTDGAGGLYAVVLFGPTARVRVWRYDIRRRRWIL